jgi:H+/Cl- antiporter ClcA
MKNRLTWAAASGCLMFVAFWVLILAVVGTSETFRWNSGRYHHGDFQRDHLLYVLLSVALALIAAGFGWIARGWYPLYTGGEAESTPDMEDD